MGSIYESGLTAHGVNFLLDNSGGRGVYSEIEGTLENVDLLGYAGGINTENCLEILKEVEMWSELAGHDFYLDLESGCRDERDWFSVEKCKEICEKCLG